MSTNGICILTETYHPVIGGGETQARALAEGFLTAGHRVSLLTRRSSPQLAAREVIGGVPVQRLGPSGSRHLNKWGLALTAGRALRRGADRFDVALVCGYRVLGIPAVATCRRLGKRSVLKADSLGEWSGDYFRAGLKKVGLRPSFPPFRLAMALRNRRLLRADRFVAISSEIAAELKAGGVPPTSIAHIPNSVDIDRFHPAAADEKCALRRRLGLPEKDPLAIYTGRLVSYKGLPLLVGVWREIAARHPRARLLLVGAGGLDIHNCESELRAFVGRHGLEGQITFVGPVDDVPSWLRAADLFVLPTENEAFGISLIEAMACGLPAVATPVGGVRDILRDGANGLSVEPRDGPGLRTALERLLTDPGLAARLGRQGREDACRKYTAERVVGLYIRLLDEITESSNEAVAS
jgi:glycosyltransferase involved in cell wall biosynthesis